MMKMNGLKKAVLLLALSALSLGFVSCAPNAAALPSVAPQDLQNLPGNWVQFVPVQALPAKLTLDGTGHAQADKTAGSWRIQDEKLWLRLNGKQTVYEYTVSGYMLTLVDDNTGDSSFYINPTLFAAQGDDDAKFNGQWAAFSTNGMLLFDGKGTLQDIFYDATAGKSTRALQYTARDGILQAIDGAGNVIYNLYSFEDNTMKLAEASDYDNDQKTWTTYWKKTESTELMTKWSRMVDQTDPSTASLPQVLELQADGKALETPTGGNPTPITWEYYDGGFLVLRYSDTNLQYAYVTHNGPTLALDTGEDTRSWYSSDSLRAALHAPKELAGQWSSDSPAMKLTVKDDGSMTFTLGDKSYPASSSTGGDLLVIRQGDTAYYVAYELTDTDLTLMYATNTPFLPDGQQSITLTKQ